MITDPGEALVQAMERTGTTREAARKLSLDEFGVDTFSKLTESQKWGVVLLVDPEAIGPYGHSMAPF